jgi:hypothetical protein
MQDNILCRVSDSELIAEVARLAICERRATVKLITHLAELDARRLYLGAGCSSMFVYCTQVLRLSEGGAYNRIEVARASRRCPLLLDFVERGALSLTTARLVAPHLTPENHADLLAAASHKSRREVEELVVRCSPKPDVRPSIREVPAARAHLPLAEPANATAPEATGMSVPAVVRRDVVPLSPDRYQVRFMASAETCKKLRRAQDLLRHAVPSGDPGQIVDRALDALLDVLVRKKLAQTPRPRAGGDSMGDCLGTFPRA